MDSSQSEPALGSTQWHGEMRSHVKDRMGGLIKGEPSWESKIQVQKEKKMQAMKILEKEQRESIKASVEKGLRKQQMYSPLQALRQAPHLSVAEKQAMKLEERKRDMAEKEGAFAEWRSEVLEKQRTREPLFKVDDVTAAKAALEEAAKKRRYELEAEEKKRWEHLEECAVRGCHKRESLYDLHNSIPFEERLAAACKKKTEEMQEMEKEQKERIRNAVASGHKKSQTESPWVEALRLAKPDNSERQKTILDEKNKQMSVTMRTYFKERDAMHERQRTREPLFSNADVSNAAQQLVEKAKKMKGELRTEQEKQMAHIDQLKNKSLERPMLMEKYW
eukprot:CAMPEP_0197655334 /NCGR_PEP_ID=MMETSP1338-20131121/39391_1 /TAXON_ID=43686 ORGANISM="Pelagodinium beii, Strain RCC1491" /NCGR_SAMPLE_ID=MMETSP1338 /ASSEMBLY_ACC=CAM_ASM_000754 /LENGTH=334 /DNA_ID=CAMNT_0043230961 /DNA_START=83 /DNA_END=1084 /DNA_ORIENTATION=-